MSFQEWDKNEMVGNEGKELLTLEMLPGLANPLAGAGLGLALFILILFVTGSVTLVVLLPAGGPINELGLLVFLATGPPKPPAAPIVLVLFAGTFV